MHPFRFGIQVSQLPYDSWRDRVRWYEDLGFTSISAPDHYQLRQWDPVALLAAVAGATRSAAVGSTVLNAGLRLPFDRAGARLSRLEEAVEAIKLLWTQETTTYSGTYVSLKSAPSVLPLPLPRQPKLLLGGTLRRAITMAGRHADIVSIFPSVASGKIGWPGWAEGSTIERTAEQTAWAQTGARDAGRSPDAIELSTQVGFTAVSRDPQALQQSIAKMTGVEPAGQDASTIFLTGTPAEARERLLRRRVATGLSYFIVFDLANNYANTDGLVPALPGDSGPGAGDRYLEAFAEEIVRPLTGQ
jgi:alkanesulfonate monooxygenase SsuD/methylene tetrahydromethanopterin reductase-like flavin-dependent oxidoreductase (luciferase family)